MDRAVLRAYGWHDLADAAPANFSPRKPRTTTPIRAASSGPPPSATVVLARLLALNAERHAEEVAAGLAPAARARREEDDVDPDFFAGDE